MRERHVSIERVLFVAPEMRARGTNEYIVHLSNYFRGLNVDAEVFCGAGPMVSILREKNIPVQTFNSLGRDHMRSKDRKRLKRALGEVQPQIIHTQTAQVARVVNDLYDDDEVPVLLTLHAIPRRSAFLRSLVPQLAIVVATSQYLREELVNECGVEKSAIQVISNAIDMDELARENVRPIFQDAVPVIGCVGPVEKARGHELFVRAAAEVMGKGRNWQFVVAGEGGELPYLRRLSSKLGLDGCLTFVGNFSSYAEILDAFDIVVQSAQVQVSGFSILDSMGRGRPVVAFNTGTACELIDSGSTGLIVPTHDVDSLAGAIERLIEHPDEARRMGEAARRQVAEHFNIRTVGPAMLDLYSQLMEGH
ncbi:MAG: glycosyltransferase family 4 protein [Planctomycetota bacterium]